LYIDLCSDDDDHDRSSTNVHDQNVQDENIQRNDDVTTTPPKRQIDTMIKTEEGQTLEEKRAELRRKIEALEAEAREYDLMIAAENNVNGKVEENSEEISEKVPEKISQQSEKRSEEKMDLESMKPTENGQKVRKRRRFSDTPPPEVLAELEKSKNSANSINSETPPNFSEKSAGESSEESQVKKKPKTQDTNSNEKSKNAEQTSPKGECHFDILTLTLTLTPVTEVSKSAISPKPSSGLFGALQENARKKAEMQAMQKRLSELEKSAKIASTTATTTPSSTQNSISYKKPSSTIRTTTSQEKITQKSTTTTPTSDQRETSPTTKPTTTSQKMPMSSTTSQEKISRTTSQDRIKPTTRQEKVPEKSPLTTPSQKNSSAAASNISTTTSQEKLPQKSQTTTPTTTSQQEMSPNTTPTTTPGKLATKCSTISPSLSKKLDEQSQASNPVHTKSPAPSLPPSTTPKTLGKFSENSPEISKKEPVVIDDDDLPLVRTKKKSEF
jgi:hypothetical protein